MSTIATKPKAAKPTRPAGKPGAKGGSKKSRAIIVAGVVLALLVLPTSVWAWIHFRHTSRVQSVQKLASAAFENRHNKDISEEQRKQAFEDVRNAMDSLTEAERQEIFRQRMEEGMRREQENMDKYMAMSAADRAAYMKKEADKEAKRMDDRAAQEKNGAGSGGSGSGSGGPGGGGRGGRNGGNPPTAEQREAWRKQMLDHTTPEQRAQHTIYRQDMAKAIGQQNNIRMAQGLPMIPAPGTSGYRGGFGR